MSWQEDLKTLDLGGCVRVAQACAKACTDDDSLAAREVVRAALATRTAEKLCRDNPAFPWPQERVYEEAARAVWGTIRIAMDRISQEQDPDEWAAARLEVETREAEKWAEVVRHEKK